MLQKKTSASSLPPSVNLTPLCPFVSRLGLLSLQLRRPQHHSVIQPNWYHQHLRWLGYAGKDQVGLFFHSSYSLFICYGHPSSLFSIDLQCQCLFYTAPFCFFVCSHITWRYTVVFKIFSWSKCVLFRSTNQFIYQPLSTQGLLESLSLHLHHWQLQYLSLFGSITDLRCLLQGSH